MSRQQNFERLIKIGNDESDDDDDGGLKNGKHHSERKMFLSSTDKHFSSSHDSSSSNTLGGIDFVIRGNHVHVNSNHLKYISLATLTVQNAALNLTMRAARTQKEQFSTSVAVTIAELLKLVTCIIVVILQEGSVFSGLNLIKKDVILNYMDTLRVAIPALVYYIQNNLLYIGSTHLDAATAQVTYQLKIFTTAIFSVLMLNKKLSKIQWMSLVTLFIGVAFIEALAVQGSGHQQPPPSPLPHPGHMPADVGISRNLNEHLELHNKATTVKKEKPIVGLLAMLVACCLSGFAGIYFEKILKKTNAVSLWIRNVQLALATLPFGVFQILFVNNGEFLNKGYFYGFSPLTWFCIFLQVQGGLLVAVVVKYANNISKGFATSLAIVIATLASVFLFNFAISAEFVLGSSLVILSVMMYNKQ